LYLRCAHLTTIIRLSLFLNTLEYAGAVADTGIGIQRPAGDIFHQDPVPVTRVSDGYLRTFIAGVNKRYFGGAACRIVRPSIINTDFRVDEKFKIRTGSIPAAHR